MDPMPADRPIAPLREFVAAFTRLYDGAPPPGAPPPGGRELLARLIAGDAWLPDEYARPDPERYTQYLLHCDPLERFSVVSFVWGPGQRTPIHNHTVWGLIGVLRGAERSQRYERTPGGMRASGEEGLHHPGDIEMVAPDRGDIHVVSNALEDRASVSIHVYGANIGAVRRSVFDAATGEEKSFISGYSLDRVPNLWDRSANPQKP
ncbi:MAG TPA: cysteine dioxygenase [Myxococcota bacterium]|nr:cysteine dioxygenase [Myxococcota bacterium]